jgi:hypothetical protein
MRRVYDFVDMTTLQDAVAMPESDSDQPYAHSAADWPTARPEKGGVGTDSNEPTAGTNQNAKCLQIGHLRERYGIPRKLREAPRQNDSARPQEPPGDVILKGPKRLKDIYLAPALQPG